MSAIPLLILAMLATLGIALTGRAAGRRQADPQIMTLVQLGVMTLISGAWLVAAPSLRESVSQAPPSILGVLAAGGIGLALGNFCYLRALASGPTGLVLILVGLSILVPTTASILFFGDKLSAGQVLGCGLALLAMVLMNAQKEEKKPGMPVRWTTLALGAMLLLGLYQTEGKHFQVAAPSASDQLYIGGSGLFAVLTSLGLTLAAGRKPRRMEVGFGAALGSLGLIQMLCILAAQRILPVSVVYLSVLGGGPILMLIIAATLLKEQYSRHVWAGAVLGILGICLMLMPG